MKYLTTILFLLIPLVCFAPAEKDKDYRTSQLETLFYALCIVESQLDSTAIGHDNDRGIAQITPVLEAEYEKRTGRDINPFSVKDSRDVFMFYADKRGPDIKCIIKRWNGSGPKTEVYYKKVKREFNNIYGYHLN